MIYDQQRNDRSNLIFENMQSKKRFKKDVFMSIKGVAMRESSGETVVLLVTMGEQSFNEFYRTLLAFIKNAMSSFVLPFYQ